MNGLYFSLAWDAGPSAEIEVFASPGGSAGAYQLRYTPPFRQVLRPPLAEISLKKDRLDGISRKLEEHITAKALQLAGDQLLTQLIPPRHRVEVDLRIPELFLEFGLEDALQGYPWELLHDGSDFLCLKHPIGRFVSNVEPSLGDALEMSRLDEAPAPLSALVIAPWKPRPRKTSTGQREYSELPAARKEAEAVAEALTPLASNGITYLDNEHATYAEVYERLRERSFHIIHYCGHAYFEASLERSGLVLADEDMSADDVAKLLGRKPPVCCFINACDTARTSADGITSATFALARAFLRSGAYLIGTRWKVADAPAAVFARKFYTSLLGSERPLGQAIRDARLACRKEAPDDPAWASYVLYGDPRLCFRKQPPSSVEDTTVSVVFGLSIKQTTLSVP